MAGFLSSLGRGNQKKDPMRESAALTTVYLLPRFSHDSESMLHEVAGLIHGLRQAAAGMKNIQQDFAEVGSRLHDTIDELNTKVHATSVDLETIKQVLREGFRLPAAGD